VGAGRFRDLLAVDAPPAAVAVVVAFAGRGRVPVIGLAGSRVCSYYTVSSDVRKTGRTEVSESG
jgi:hypothetical protein